MYGYDVCFDESNAFIIMVYVYFAWVSREGCDRKGLCILRVCFSPGKDDFFSEDD